MKQRGGPVLKKRGLESATGERGEKGGKADEMEREIRKEDLDRESGGEDGRRRASESVREREW